MNIHSMLVHYKSLDGKASMLTDGEMFIVSQIYHKMCTGGGPITYRHHIDMRSYDALLKKSPPLKI